MGPSYWADIQIIGRVEESNLGTARTRHEKTVHGPIFRAVPARKYEKKIVIKRNFIKKN